MVEKLLKEWNALKAGQGVTTDPAEARRFGALLIGRSRLQLLRAQGYLALPEDERPIPIVRDRPAAAVRGFQPKGGA